MLNDDQIIKIARIMGYDPMKPAELNGYIKKISEMDSWEISKLLFFDAQNEEINSPE